LFLLVYLKTYPLQVVLGELFDLSQPAGELLDSISCCPAVQAALDRLGVRPERDPRHFAQAQPAAEAGPG